MHLKEMPDLGTNRLMKTLEVQDVVLAFSIEELQKVQADIAHLESSNIQMKEQIAFNLQDKGE